MYFKISSFEAGAINTGKRSANYHCSLEIYDKDLLLIKDHPLKDVFYGKWSKCQSVLNKWERICKKNGLINFYDNKTK